MTYLGRDFSSFQGNLSDADCEGIDFAYVKATQGSSYINPFAPQQVRALRAAGVKVGLYHFVTVVDSIGDQLHNFATYAQSLGGSQLPPALDCETSDPAGWGALAVAITRFAVGVEGWGEPVPNTQSVIYVNLSFYESLPGFPWGRSVWLADPNSGAPHKPCLILQGAPRPVSGADPKSVDPDTFMGSEAEWEAFIGEAAAIVHTGPPEGSSPPPNTVPGPNGLQLVVVGSITPEGFAGHEVTGGKTVYAGFGNPTSWVTGFDFATLPVGTPLAVAVADWPFVAS